MSTIFKLFSVARRQILTQGPKASLQSFPVTSSRLFGSNQDDNELLTWPQIGYNATLAKIPSKEEIGRKDSNTDTKLDSLESYIKIKKNV